MNAIKQQERALTVHGVEARAFGVVVGSSGRILHQKIGATRYYQEKGRRYRITAELRFDDQCNNGHETFSATADIHEAEGGYWREYMGGCCHDEIARHFPEWAHLLKWHLVSTDGPMHYTANTIYHAGDRDHRGLRKGEQYQLRNGKTGLLCWRLEGPADKYHDGDAPPPNVVLKWQPWMIEGEGKVRELDHARNSAVWPEATDAELMQEPAALKAALLARLPALLAAFKADMIEAGFMWPGRVPE